MTTKLSAQLQKKAASYYGEISLAVREESNLKLEQMKSKFNEDGLRIKITLESGDGSTIEPEFLEVWSADWQEWDKL